MRRVNCEGRFGTVCETNPLKNDKYQKLERIPIKYDPAYSVLFVYQIWYFQPQTRNSYHIFVVSTVGNMFPTLFRAVLIHVNTLITTSQA